MSVLHQTIRRRRNHFNSTANKYPPRTLPRQRNRVNQLVRLVPRVCRGQARRIGGNGIVSRTIICNIHGKSRRTSMDGLRQTHHAQNGPRREISRWIKKRERPMQTNTSYMHANLVPPFRVQNLSRSHKSRLCNLQTGLRNANVTLDALHVRWRFRGAGITAHLRKEEPMIGEMEVFQLWNVPHYQPVIGVVWCLSQRMWEK